MININMKTAEILRSLANLIDAEEQAAQQPVQPQVVVQPPPVVVNINNSEKVTKSAATAEPAEEPVSDNLGVMVPPLQQKIELMKKSAGVESAYDQDPEEDELDILKRQAGIIALVDEDEPFEG
jgi:hypothetical protein